MEQLTEKKVAVLAANGFEQSELEQPVKALKEAGAMVEIVSLEAGSIKGWSGKDWGDEVAVDKTISDVKATDYDALFLPGGVMNPDTLRMDKDAVQFVAEFMNAAKPVAAICHGAWTLVESGTIKGRTLTSWPSLKTDIENAGATWVDEEVVTDNGLVTSRKPEDLPAFCKKMIEEIAEGKHS